MRREVSIRRFRDSSSQSGDFSPESCGAGTYEGPAGEAEIHATGPCRTQLPKIEHARTGSSTDRRRPAEPPSTPRATRATPPPPPASSTRDIHDFTLDDPDQGVEYWKTRAIRAEAQTDMYKDRAEADALRERAAAAERELIIRCGDESDRSRSRSASRAPSRDPSMRPGRMGARQREEEEEQSTRAKGR